MKTLVLKFKTAGGSISTMSVANAKDTLTRASVQEAAAKMLPVFVSAGGAELVSLDDAYLVTTEKTLLN
jgi:hypothetical protein